jgi:hypothetical protein
MTRIAEKSLQPFSPSLEGFCYFVDYCTQQTTDPQTVAALWESQVEAVRINQEDINAETIDLLLNTMLNTLDHMAEVQEQKRWKNRLKSAVISSVTGRKPQPTSSSSLVLQYS